MSDCSGPHRLDELESKVEKMMDMMSQLLEAKSEGGGQQREKRGQAAPAGDRPQLLRRRREDAAHY